MFLALASGSINFTLHISARNPNHAEFGSDHFVTAARFPLAAIDSSNQIDMLDSMALTLPTPSQSLSSSGHHDPCQPMSVGHRRIGVTHPSFASLRFPVPRSILQQHIALDQTQHPNLSDKPSPSMQNSPSILSHSYSLPH